MRVVDSLMKRKYKFALIKTKLYQNEYEIHIHFDINYYITYMLT